MALSRTKRQVAGRALAGVLLAGVLGVGCSSEEPPESQEAARQEQAQTGEQVLPPKLASLEAVPQEPLSSATRSLVRARLAEGESSAGFFISGDDGVAIALRDDGTNGDEVARDGVFSGFGIVDFDTHWQTQQRIVDLQKQTGALPTMTIFNGREAVGEQEVEPLPMDLFKPGVAIPIRPVGLADAPVTDEVAGSSESIASIVNYSRSLVITDPGVVNDPARTWDPCTGAGNPNGAWTFNYLMTEMANQPLTGIAPSTFTQQWLNQWTFNPSINGLSVPARTAITAKLLNPWPKVGTALNMARSPFKLVAIVNRPDLVNLRGGAYGGGEAGELRFVFAAVETVSGACRTTPFLVILEYGVPVAGCTNVKNWARRWRALSLYTPGPNSTYNQLLQNLTDSVVRRNAAPAKPNGSAINQVRTNEVWLGSPWELREFRIFSARANPENFRSGATAGHLTQHVTVQTPADGHNNTALLANYISTNCAQLAANNYTIPLNWPAAANDFLGSFPRMPTTNTFWTAPTLPPPPCGPQARFNLSFNTCNGCHTRETYARFWHIDENGNRSPFLSGPITVADPVFGNNRNFNEPLRRIQVLDSVANQSCLAAAFNSASPSH